MSYTSQRLAMTHLVRDIHKVDGLIADTAEGRDHPVFPKRDQRKRPVIWIEQAGFHWLRGQAMIEPHLRGFVLAETVVRRLNSGHENVEDLYLTQHQGREAREIYTPDHVVRAANINMRSTPLDRLARRRGQEADGRFLSAAEIEAGHALMRDYYRSGEGQTATQDFTNPWRRRRR